MIYKLSKMISPAFYDVHKMIKRGEIDELVAEGGRGSAKSSFVSVEGTIMLLKHPECHMVVMRKIGNTLRTSVYPQMQWAIGQLGLSHLFRSTVSPMEMIYTPTGQKIMFFGMDDPGKIKSLKVPFGYVGIAWFEELDQFSGPEEIRNVEQSLFRGGSFSFAFKSFNPPAMARNWANRYAKEEKARKVVHHSTYETTPKMWLGERFMADAEHLKETNPTAYRHEYLGEIVGSGTQVFENVEFRTITNEEMDRFDRVYNGLDFGWYPDPLAFARVHYDKTRETLYIIDEYGGNKIPNAKAAEEIKKGGYNDRHTICDSADPRSTYDLRDNGINAKLAIKGPGSVEYSMRWLQGRKIVIDPQRTPRAAKEFGEYEYERDKNGDVMSGYPDVDNHYIDAVRYALEEVWSRRRSNA